MLITYLNHLDKYSYVCSTVIYIITFLWFSFCYAFQILNLYAAPPPSYGSRQAQSLEMMIHYLVRLDWPYFFITSISLYYTLYTQIIWAFKNPQPLSNYSPCGWTTCLWNQIWIVEWILPTANLFYIPMESIGRQVYQHLTTNIILDLKQNSLWHHNI